MNKETKISRAELARKGMLTRREAAVYLGVTLGWLNQLCARREIPYYKPRGKNTYFDPKELDEWCKGVRIKTRSEITAEAARR